MESALTVRDQNIETIFEGRLLDSDITWVTLRGHVFVEAMLRRAVRNKVSRAQHIDKLGLKYPKLVHLAIALDAIPEDFASAFFKLDSLRNRLGHELKVDIGWDEAHAVAEALPADWFAWLNRRYDGDEKLVHYIRDVVNLLVLILHFGAEDVHAARQSPVLEEMRNRFKADVLDAVAVRQ
jgi:hypothetical protein